MAGRVTEQVGRSGMISQANMQGCFKGLAAVEGASAKANLQR